MYDDDQDALAAEYVLGTLSGDERDQAEALLVIDPGFAEIVRVWERRLGELNVMVEAVEPPPEVWDKIKTEIGGAEPRAATEAEIVPPASKKPAPETAPSTSPDMAAAAAPYGNSSRGRSRNRLRSRREVWIHRRRKFGCVGAAAGFDQSSLVAALASSLLSPNRRSRRRPRQPSPSELLGIDPAAKPSAAPTSSIWRAASGAGAASTRRDQRDCGAACGLYRGRRSLRPDLIPLSRQPQTATAAPAAPSRRPSRRGLATGSDCAGLPAHGRSAKPHADGAQGRRDAGAGRSYELWLISKQIPDAALAWPGRRRRIHQPPLPCGVSMSIRCERRATRSRSNPPAARRPARRPVRSFSPARWWSAACRS